MRGWIICSLWLSGLATTATATVSSYILTAFAIEIYLAIIHPTLHKNYVTRRNIVIFVVGNWFVSVAAPAGILLKLSRVIGGLCYYSYEWPSMGISVGIANLVVRMAIPLAIYVFCYSRIVIFLRSRNKINSASSILSNHQSPTHQPVAYVRAQRNVILTVFYAIVLHAFTWTGYQVFLMMAALDTPLSTTSPLSQVLQLGVYTNSCVNPIVYVVKYERFRKAAKLVCRHWLRRVPCRTFTLHKHSRSTTNGKSAGNNNGICMNNIIVH
jgi:hypothetical protein